MTIIYSSKTTQNDPQKGFLSQQLTKIEDNYFFVQNDPKRSKKEAHLQKEKNKKYFLNFFGPLLAIFD